MIYGVSSEVVVGFSGFIPRCEAWQSDSCQRGKTYSYGLAVRIAKLAGENGKLHEDPAVLLTWTLSQRLYPAGEIVDELRTVVLNDDVVHDGAYRWFDCFHLFRQMLQLPGLFCRQRALHLAQCAGPPRDHREASSPDAT